MKTTPKDVLEAYSVAYRGSFDCPAPIAKGKDAKIAKDLLALYSMQDLQRWLHLFFEIPDPFIQSTTYSLGVFRACLGKIISYEARLNGKSPQVVSARTASILSAAQSALRDL